MVGSPAKQGTSGVHGAPLGDTEIEAARLALDWPHGPFEIPADILAEWRAVGARGDSTRAVWQKQHDSHPKAALFDAAMRGDVPDELAAAILDWKSILAADPQKLATRVAGKTLEAILPACPTFGGSADLTGSNNTKVADHGILTVTITAALISIMVYANMAWRPPNGIASMVGQFLMVAHLWCLPIIVDHQFACQLSWGSVRSM